MTIIETAFALALSFFVIVGAITFVLLTWVTVILWVVDWLCKDEE